MDGWMNDGKMDEWMMDGRMDGRMDDEGWMDDGWMEGLGLGLVRERSTGGSMCAETCTE